MKKRFAAAVLAGTLALSLAACGSSTSSASGDTTSADTTAAEESADTEAADTAEVKKIKVATGTAPRPYVYVDEDNNPTGYDVEVLKAIFEQLPQYEVEFEVVDRDALFAGLQAGQYQVGVRNLSYSEERAKTYLYSLPYDKISYVFVNAEDAAEPVTSFETAAGKIIETGTGNSISTAVENWNDAHADLQINLKYTEADMLVQLQNVIDGASDFSIIDTAMYNAYVEEYGLEGLTATPLSEEDTREIAESDYAYYLLGQDQTQLREDIDEVLAQLQADGTLTALGQEFQGRDDCAPEDDQMVSTPN